MVSFQAFLPSNTLYHHIKTISYLETFPTHPNHPSSNCKKRKLDETHDHHPRRNPVDPPITAFSSSPTVDLHLESPLPSEWQRFLDIQSGEIHFYNTRTKKRTLKDPRDSEDDDHHDQASSTNMSLDLELNLPCGDRHWRKTPILNKRPNNSNESGTLSLFSCSPVSPEGVVDVDKEEMVAAACKRCHMLVVLCKSSPACPNCKFVNPPDHPAPPKMFKPRLSLIY